ALRQRKVGLNVIIELDQANLVALLFELRHDGELENVIVVASSGTKNQVLLVGVSVSNCPAECDCGGNCAHQDTATNVHETNPCRRGSAKKEFNACPDGAQSHCHQTG